MATVITGLKRMRVSVATIPKNVRELIRAGVRTLAEWALKGLVSAAGRGRRSAEHERFPIVWDADPVGLYVVRYERERALGVAR
ncbi:hypothetical protein ACH4U7_14485 [Streptomyces sp. NPDC020845]|uniref:hypothetical protein n=1 Tax=Streptomyces sp. NPDC020845 TaxID=3365096 RepID=UPI0037BE04F8